MRKALLLSCAVMAATAAGCGSSSPEAIIGCASDYADRRGMESSTFPDGDLDIDVLRSDERAIFMDSGRQTIRVLIARADADARRLAGQYRDMNRILADSRGLVLVRRNVIVAYDAAPTPADRLIEEDCL